MRTEESNNEKRLNTALSKAGIQATYKEMLEKKCFLTYELDGENLLLSGVVESVSINRGGNLELFVSKAFIDYHAIKSLVFKDGAWWIVQKINIHSSEKYFKVLEFKQI